KSPVTCVSMVLPGLALVGLLSGCGGEGGGTAAPAAAAAPGGGGGGAGGGASVALAGTGGAPPRVSGRARAPRAARARPATTALVVPVVEGQISQVLVSWGAAVTKGQVLAVLDSAAVGEAKAADLRARAELQVAESTFKRMQTLSSGKIVAAKDLMAAEADRTSAQAEADAAEKALRLMGFTADDVAH